MKGVVEDDDRRPAGRDARDLDGVLDRFGAGVDEQRALLTAATGREVRESLAHLDVRLVHPDEEALMKVAVGLLLDRLDDGRVAVTGVLAADAAREVDVRTPVDVRDARPLGLRDDELGRHDSRRDVTRAALGDVFRGGSLLEWHRAIIEIARIPGNSDRSGATAYSVPSAGVAQLVEQAPCKR